MTQVPASSHGGGPAAGAYLPAGSQSGVTLDTTTYDNPIAGTGKLATLVTNGDDAWVAVAESGDAFPRYLFASSSGDGIYLGDGTFDPYASGANLGYYKDAQIGVAIATGPHRFGGGVTLRSANGAPTAGGNVGDLYIRKDGGALTTLYRCTVAGAAGAATWTGIL